MGNVESQPPVQQPVRKRRKRRQIPAYNRDETVSQQKYNQYLQSQQQQQQGNSLAQQQKQYLQKQYQQVQQRQTSTGEIPHPSQFSQLDRHLVVEDRPQVEHQIVKQYNFANIDIINVNDKIKDFEDHEIKTKQEFNEEQEKREQQFGETRKRQRDIFNREIQLFEKNHDPFKILGLDYDNISLSKIKRAYKIKAQRSHPDKGGDPEVFKKVTQAYCYLVNKYDQEEEFERKIEKEVRHEEYDSRMNDGYENVHISKDNFNISKFNDIFNRYRVDNAFDKGYGDMMSKDQCSDDSVDSGKSLFNNKSFNIDVFNQTFADDTHDELIVYDEPQALPSSAGFYQELGQGKIKDFGSSDGSLQFTDYKKAYSKDNKFINPDTVKYREYKNIGELKAARSNISHTLSPQDQEKIKMREIHEQEFEKKRQNRIKREEDRYNQQFNQLNKLFIKN